MEAVRCASIATHPSDPDRVGPLDFQGGRIALGFRVIQHFDPCETPQGFPDRIYVSGFDRLHKDRLGMRRTHRDPHAGWMNGKLRRFKDLPGLPQKLLLFLCIAVG